MISSLLHLKILSQHLGSPCQRTGMELVRTFDSIYSWISCVSLSTSLLTLILWFFSKKPQRLGDAKSLPVDLEARPSFHGNEILVLPGCTSHTRLSPKVHSFSYNFLITAVPVRNCKSNWFAAIDNATKPWWRRGWLRVDTPDHLHRGDDELGLPIS